MVRHDDELLEFFKACDGVSWPDVNSGYFIGSLSSIASLSSGSPPKNIVGATERTKLAIGSTGGGTLCAADCATGAVLLLPTSRIVDGVYAEPDGRVKQISDKMIQFADRLRRDLKAFVDDSADSEYVE